MRWYDNHPRFRECIEKIKDFEKEERNMMVQGIITFINQSHYAELIGEKAIDFPLDSDRRRWYDKSPYLWLVMNGLQYADEKFINRVAEYLEERIMVH